MVVCGVFRNVQSLLADHDRMSNSVNELLYRRCKLCIHSMKLGTGRPICGLHAYCPDGSFNTHASDTPTLSRLRLLSSPSRSLRPPVPLHSLLVPHQ